MIVLEYETNGEKLPSPLKIREVYVFHEESAIIISQILYRIKNTNNVLPIMF